MEILASIFCPETEHKIRLCDFLVGKFEDLPTKSSCRKAIQQKRILVDGKTVSRAAWMLPGSRIDLILDPNKLPKMFELKLKLLYEDEYLAVIQKPAGFAVSGNFFKTIQNALAFNLKSSSLKDALLMPRPVHRLDKDTSGLLLIAKSYTCLRKLQDQFKASEIIKKYYAIVTGDTDAEGLIDQPIDGKHSRTKFSLLQQVDNLHHGKLSLIKIDLLTGRKHQIRIHFSSRGVPVAGDKLYGVPGNTMKHKGLFLIAYHLEFVHPINLKNLSFELDLPYKFKAYMSRSQKQFLKYSR